MNAFGKRLLTAGVVLPLVILSVHAGPVYLAALMAVIAILGARELVLLARCRGGGCPLWVAGVAVIGGITAQAGLVPIPPLTMITGVLALAMVVELFRVGGSVLTGAPLAVFAAVYLGILPAHLIRLYDLGETARPDPFAIDYALALIWTGDTAAYLVGSRIGRVRLMPRVSPGKSWEGAIGGLAACVGVAVLLGRWAPHPSIVAQVGAGVVVAVAGMVGDLCESFMKREAAMKDSGTIFPGHGGVLDRIDSLLFAAPALYYWFDLFQRNG
jgi:phosphatidate cytidylyltransferase